MKDMKLPQVGLEPARLLTKVSVLRYHFSCRYRLCQVILVSGSLAQPGQHRNGNPRVVGSSPTEIDFMSRIEKLQHNVYVYIYMYIHIYIYINITNFNQVFFCLKLCEAFFENKCTITISITIIISVRSFKEKFFLRHFNQQS